MEKNIINLMPYGFPSRENGKYLNDSTIYDRYFSHFANTPPFANDSAETYKEILIVSEALNDTKDKEAHLFIDRDFYGYLIGQLKKQGIIITNDTIMKIIMNVAPLCMRLKVHYQRPRPFQLGLFANVPLFPHASLPAQAPAYPSGHGCQSRYLALCLSAFFPEKQDFLMKLSDYIAHSRVSIGVHFPSDNSFGQAIAEYVFKMPETSDFLKSIEGEIQVAV